MTLLILSIIIIILYIHLSINTEIIFYSTDEVKYNLYNTFNKYFKTMSQENLNIRHIDNVNEYINNINDYFYDLTIIDKLLLTYHINKAHANIIKFTYPGFNGHKLKDIPWLIVCSKDKKFEFGFPHTQHKFIILNKSNLYNDLYKTLIHERIHIYQRLFPEDMQYFMYYFNFKKINIKNKNDRVNPDTDKYIYSINDKLLECKINDKQILCTNNNSIFEHPYEIMAYYLSNHI